MQHKNWKHANQIAAGAWDVEHEHELNKLPTPYTYIFSSFEVGKENDRGSTCNLTCRTCTRCCNFAQIWHPSPYNYIFRSFEVGNEKGRTEEIEFDNLYHHPQFHFPEPWSGTWNLKTENMQTRLSQVHEMLNMSMKWTNYQHPTPTFSRDMEHKNWKHANQIAAGAWDVEHVHELNRLTTPHEFWSGKRKTTEEAHVIWLAAGARDVVILHKYDTPAPTITFSGVLK